MTPPYPSSPRPACGLQLDGELVALGELGRPTSTGSSSGAARQRGHRPDAVRRRRAGGRGLPTTDEHRNGKSAGKTACPRPELNQRTRFRKVLALAREVLVGAISQFAGRRATVAARQSAMQALSGRQQRALVNWSGCWPTAADRGGLLDGTNKPRPRTPTSCSDKPVSQTGSQPSAATPRTRPPNARPPRSQPDRQCSPPLHMHKRTKKKKSAGVIHLPDRPRIRIPSPATQSPYPPASPSDRSGSPPLVSP